MIKSILKATQAFPNAVKETLFTSRGSQDCSCVWDTGGIFCEKCEERHKNES